MPTSQPFRTKEEVDGMEANFGTSIWKIGELRWNSTTGELEFWDGTRWTRQAASTFSKGATIISPTGALDIVIWEVNMGSCDVVSVSGYRVGGVGATINARVNSTDEHLASDLSLTSADTWISTTTVQNIHHANGDSLEVRLKSVDGSPSLIAMQVGCVYVSD